MDTIAIRPNLRIEFENVNIHSYNERVPDPSWRLIDKNGHGHFYTAAGSDHYPTLREITHEEEDDDLDEPYLVFDHYECPHCGEVIEPGMKYSDGKQSIDGSKRYFIDNAEIDRDVFVEVWKREMFHRIEDQAEEI